MPIHKKFLKEVTFYSLDEMLADPKLKANLLKANEETDDFLNLSLENDMEDLTTELEAKGFYEVKIYYDLSYCQGSGAYFTFDGVNVLKLMGKEKSIYKQAQKVKYLFKDNTRNLKEIDSYTGIKTIQNHWANHYCHSRCTDIEFDYAIGVEEITNDIKEFEFVFNELYQDICHRIYRRLEKSLEYYQSEEFLIEDLKAQDMDYFFESGGAVPWELLNNPTLINNIEGFINSEHSYVITDADGKIFSYKDSREILEDGDFIDSSEENDLGLSKAVIFPSTNEAHEFIVDTLVNNYQIISVDQAFNRGGANDSKRNK